MIQNQNENIKNNISMLAPKCKKYSKTKALENCVPIESRTGAKVSYVKNYTISSKSISHRHYHASWIK